MRRRHAISPESSGHYQDLGIQSLTGHAASARGVSFRGSHAMVRAETLVKNDALTAAGNLTFETSRHLKQWCGIYYGETGYSSPSSLPGEHTLRKPGEQSGPLKLVRNRPTDY